MTDRLEFVIGLDGGGSGCRAALGAPDGTVLATAHSGSANYTSDPDGTVAHILTALTEVTSLAGVSFDRVKEAPAHLGLAGIVTHEDAQSCAVRLPLKNCRISNDQLTSAIGAFGSQDGALVGVGTGSFVAIKRGDSVRSIGGWGLHLGDQASGAWLGRLALQRCALVTDGLAKPSPFIEDVLQTFELDANRMIAFAQKAAPADYAAFAPNIFDAASHGDPHACDMIRKAAEYLDLCLDTAGLIDGEGVCLVGGLAPLYAPWLNERHQARVAEPLGTALDGAIRLAWKRTAT
jgi:glucosamine kinase